MIDHDEGIKGVPGFVGEELRSRALFSAPQHIALPNKPLRYYPPSFYSSAADGMSHINAIIHHINPQTLQAEAYTIPLSYDNVNSGVLTSDTSLLQSIRFVTLPCLLQPIEEPFRHIQALR